MGTVLALGGFITGGEKMKVIPTFRFLYGTGWIGGVWALYFDNSSFQSIIHTPEE